MKRKLSILKICLIIFIATFCLMKGSYAEELAVSYYLQEGASYLKNEKKEEAIQSFTKALMLDPSSEEAEKNLRELGVSDASIALIKEHNLQTDNLSNQIDADQAQMGRLEKEKSALQEESKALQAQNQQLQEQKKRHAP